MAMNQDKEMRSVREAADFAIVGDNISDIAEFTVEKYEFKHDTALSSETREEGIARIKDVLWKQMEDLKRRRMQLLAEMFTLAETTLEEVVKQGK